MYSWSSMSCDFWQQISFHSLLCLRAANTTADERGEKNKCFFGNSFSLATKGGTMCSICSKYCHSSNTSDRFKQLKATCPLKHRCENNQQASKSPPPPGVCQETLQEVYKKHRMGDSSSTLSGKTVTGCVKI